jgi:hypothetical protein
VKGKKKREAGMREGAQCKNLGERRQAGPWVTVWREKVGDGDTIGRWDKVDVFEPETQ